MGPKTLPFGIPIQIGQTFDRFLWELINLGSKEDGKYKCRCSQEVSNKNIVLELWKNTLTHICIFPTQIQLKVPSQFIIGLATVRKL